MSNIPKSIVGRKKNDRPQPIDLKALITRRPQNEPQAPRLDTSQSNQLPSLPPVPNIPRPDILTPSRLRSPHDETKIIVNGKAVDVGEMVDNRINGEERVRPLTPPRHNPINARSPEFIQSNLTPNKYVDSNINIVETPREETNDSPKSEYSDNEDSPNSNIENFTIPSFMNQPVPVPSQPPQQIQISQFKQINNYPFDKVRQQQQSKNIKSLLPAYNKPPEDKNKPNMKEFLNQMEQHSPETVRDEDDEDEEQKQPFSPVNIPYPVFENIVRSTSPIQTIGPKSPSMLNLKPNFTENGKSSTPRPAQVKAITPPKIAANIKAVTPPPMFRSPRFQPPTPENNESNDNIYKETSTPVAPQSFNEYYERKQQQQARVSNRPNYDKITKEQEIYLRSEFKVKFGILRSSYPQWEVIEPHDSLTLDQIHDLYDHYLKQIMISRETGNYKTYMVIFLMVIEVIGVKFLKLNMSGYTMSQLRIMNRYDSLFMELGEKYLIAGGSDWPVEARIIMMMLFNAVIFLVVRYLCSWMGMEGIADTLQSMIDSMLNGPSMLSHNGPIGTNNAIPDPLAPSSSTAAQSSTDSSGNPIDKIADLFGNFVSKNSGNITEKIAEIGTMFTNKTQTSNIAAKQTAPKKPQPTKNVDRTKRKKLDKKSLFGE